MIGVLREGAPEAAPEPPQPTLAEVPALVEESRVGRHARGARASTCPDDAALPAALGRTAYRVVQEGLTNARKHAPGAAVDVTIAARAGAALVVEVVSRRAVGVAAAGRAIPGAGTGLVGPGRARRARRRRGSSTAPTARATSSCARPCPGRRDRQGPRPARRRRRARALGAADDARGRGRASTSSARPTTGAACWRAVDLHRPDVVLMDIRMPQLDGIAATRLLRSPARPAGGDRADDLRRRRARAARAARGRGGLPAQGHAAGRASCARSSSSTPATGCSRRRSRAG